MAEKGDELKGCDLDATFCTAEDSFDVEGGDGTPPPPPPPLPLSPCSSRKKKSTFYIFGTVVLVLVIIVGIAVGVSKSARNASPSKVRQHGKDNFSGPDDYAGPGGEENQSDDRFKDNAIGIINETIADTAAELPSMPSPQYVDSPLSPSCSRPPAWADDDLFWSDLSADQRNAALYVGYTPTAWDAGDDALVDHLYANWAWYDLTPERRLAYEYLGYNSGSYENFYNDYYFDELPLEVQDAADEVGYTRDVWDECEDEICVPGIDDVFWKGLSRMDRIRLKVLGYDCWTWNNYDFANGR